MTASDQRGEFVAQFASQFGVVPTDTADWSNLFWQLSKMTQSGRVLIVLDEITWMEAGDPVFLGKLKNAWDLYFKDNHQLVLILCGSVSAWIEENILNSTGFFGRVSITLTLDEMPLSDCAKFWPNQDGRVSAYERLKMLSVTGGIPRYLEGINPKLSAEQNIQALCFNESGILYGEFEKIFTDLFGSKGAIFEKIITFLADGVADQKAITEHLGLLKSGDVSNYLSELVSSGFISRDYTWHLRNGARSKLSCYRLKDNYSRFYLKNILPNKERILANKTQGGVQIDFKGWDSIMGLQVENLVLSNRLEIKKMLGIDPRDVEIDNPFFQRKSKIQVGCQIDYMIQTKHNVLYVCEIKFSKHEVGFQVVEEVREKINRLRLPRGFSYRPVLIHVNGVSDSVLDERYFSDIIDLTDLLESKEL